jgi:hypothetical protein
MPSKTTKPHPYQSLIQGLKKLDPDEYTPKQALQKLYDIQKMLHVAEKIEED